LLSALILPPVSPLLLIFAGLLLLRFSKRWAQAAMLQRCFAVVGAVMFSQRLRFEANFCCAAIHLWTSADLQKAQAIVVLGAGVELYAPEYGQPII
jgi:hypothetical protein